MKIENYIEEIKNDQFFAGNIELAASSILFNLNISLYINENARRDSMFYTFVSGYSVNDNMLTIDSFSCDGGIMTPYIKPLTLYKQ